MNRNDMFDFYDFVQWSDESSDIPVHNLNENTKITWWSQSEKTPVKHENRVVFISLPTAKGISINTQFWCLYSPASSTIDGFYEFPKDIAQSGLVLCSVLENLETTDEGCWFVVSVVDMKMFDKALVDMDVNQVSDDFLTSIQLFKNFDHAKCKDWIYVSNYADENYIGNEFFIQKQANQYHLICYVEWSYSVSLKENTSTAWYGNSILNQETIKMLDL